MKKIICSLLVFAGLGMCACNSKDGEPNKDEVFNSAFFSEDSLVKMAEKKGYIEFDEFSKEVGKELTKDGEVSITDDMVSEAAAKKAGDKLIYKVDHYFSVFDSETAGLLFNSEQPLEMEYEGLYLRAYIDEEFKLDPDYDDLAEYGEDLAESFFVAGNFNKVEISEDVIMFYDEQGDCYEVYLCCQDTSAGSMVEMLYYIPLEDNEKAVKELKDLGVPAVTDYLK